MIIENWNEAGIEERKKRANIKRDGLIFMGFCLFFYAFFFFFFKKGNLKDTLMVSATQPSLHC